MNFLGALLTLIFTAGALLAPRRVAALFVMMGVCYITQGQVVDVFGFHFMAVRFVLLAAVIKGFSVGGFRNLKPSPIDKLVLVYALVSAAVFIVRENAFAAAVGQFGTTYNVLLSYLAFRLLLLGYEDLEAFLGGLAILIVPLALLLMLESQTGHDLFGIFGGVPASDEFRDGHYRCCGSFRSPITAGTFGATLMPIFLGMWLARVQRGRMAIGIAASSIIVMCSRSSGPLLAYGAAIIGMLLWRLRDHMRLIRRGSACALIGLHLYMKAPVWFLMGHMSDIVGGGGWHRAEIVDAAVKNFRTWWLCGTSQTGNWVATELTSGGADLTNQFVVEGVTSGLVGMILFIWLIVRAFGDLGRAMRKVMDSDPDLAIILWALGATLFATVVNFFSVSYFDQIHVIWWGLLAMIAGVTSDILARPIDESDDETIETEVEVLVPEAAPSN